MLSFAVCERSEALPRGSSPTSPRDRLGMICNKGVAKERGSLEPCVSNESQGAKIGGHNYGEWYAEDVGIWLLITFMAPSRMSSP